MAPDSTRYDLYLRPDGAGFAWKIPDRGILLSAGSIVWTIDGARHTAALNEIAAVHLQTNSIGQTMLGTCRIRLTNFDAVSVLSSNEDGVYGADQVPIYRAFVLDLHARLAALPQAAVDFTAGYSAAREWFGMALMVIVALFFIVMPTVLLLISHAFKMVSALYFGVLLAWPFYKLIRANAPRIYDPGSLPREMIDL